MLKLRYSSLAAAMVMGLSGAPVAQAQPTGGEQTVPRSGGSISGRIIDPGTGEYLRNAIIRVETATGARSVRSGARGEYRVADVPAGPVRLTVQFTGYAPAEIDLQVQAGAPTRQDIELFSTAPVAGTARNLETMRVVGVREGDARALMEQRASMDITNSLSAESYGEISEGNPGEFMKFMPGVDTDSTGDGTVRHVSLRGLPADYTSITINGISLASADANTGAGGSRTFSFEQTSLTGIDSISIFKTTSADKDANSPAGTIDIRTKRAFDRSGRDITVQLSATTHSNQWDSRRRTGPREGGYGSDRFLPSGRIDYSDVFMDGRLGVVAGVSHSELYVEQEQITASRNYNPTPESPEPLAVTRIVPQMGTREITRSSGSLNVDFKATDGLILSLMSSIGRGTILAGSTAPEITTYARSGVEGNPATRFTPHEPVSLAARNTLTYKYGTTRNFIPSFEYSNQYFTLDGNVFYSSSESTYNPNRKGAVHSMVAWPTATGHASIDRGDEYLEQAWQVQQLDGGDWSLPSAYDITGTPTMRLRNSQSADVLKTGGGLNLAFDREFGSTIVTFKTGAKLENARYDFDNPNDSWKYRYVGPLSTAELLERIQTTNQHSAADSGVDYRSVSGAGDMYFPSMFKLYELYQQNPEHWEHTLSPTDWYNAFVGNRRHFEEETRALYFMGTAELTPNLTVRAGVRWEQTRNAARETDPLGTEELVAAGYEVDPAKGRATTIEGLEYQYSSRPEVYRKGKYDHFFPSASAKYAFNDSTDLQLGYSRTIQRPAVSVLSGVWSVNDEAMTIRAPNPELEPQLSDNFSVRLAKYFEPVGIIGLNYYRNRVKGLFQAVEMTAEEFGYTGDQYADYTFIRTEVVDGNAIDIEGWELEFSHAMDYLPGAWGGLSVRGSFMLNNPEVPLVRAADKLGTFSVSWQHGPARLYLNTVWTDDKYRSTTPSWFSEYWDTNLSGSYAFTEGWEAFFNIRNLLDKNRNVIVPNSLSPTGELGGSTGTHGAIYIHGGRNATVGIRGRF
ncbi:TonB-dependent receptor domain-containing protein [Luteimonas sp. JM171]|uniref:TonB-dependent receptor n=1 Tax=Luteimonas sp. JM171 TaxID=1896164 RepID=UPI00138FE23D|nr:TonB-dependent receptor [Luteimonas sp. JM171]